MAKVKVFCAACADDLEKQVNAWLEDHPDADIIVVTQSESQYAGELNLSYTILCRE